MPGFGRELSRTGHDGSGLSPTTVVRMKEVWQGEFENFSRRSLVGKRYLYVWADGIYFNIRLGDDRPCVLVLMGALEDGIKELIAMIDGQRESEQSWLELLLDVKSRGLVDAPLLATGDGALGFWKAIRQVYPSTRHQRCWVHKTVNVLDKLPKGQHPSAKAMLHEIWMSATKEDAIKTFDRFIATYQAKYPKAVECLSKDRDELLAFYDFPAEHPGLSLSKSGSTCGRATRSRARSRRCVCGRAKPKAPAAGPRAWRWLSNWWRVLRSDGGNSTAARCCPTSSPE